MGNWYYMWCWVNVWNYRRKNIFLKNFNNFFSCENDLSVIFGFLTPKLIKVPIFMKIQSTKLEIWMKMYYHKFPRWLPRVQKRGIVVQSFDHNISEILWDRCLKFGTFTYPHSMHLCSKFHWNLKRWVSGMPHFDVEFSQSVEFHISHQVKPNSRLKAMRGLSYTCFSIFGELGQVGQIGPKYPRSWTLIHRKSFKF